VRFFDVNDGLSVNLEKVVMVTRSETGNAELTMQGQVMPVSTNIQFDVMRKVIEMKGRAEQVIPSKAEQHLEQLAKFQTQQVP
jgi:hypothetical protein